METAEAGAVISQDKTQILMGLLALLTGLKPIK